MVLKVIVPAGPWPFSGPKPAQAVKNVCFSHTALTAATDSSHKSPQDLECSTELTVVGAKFEGRRGSVCVEISGSGVRA